MKPIPTPIEQPDVDSSLRESDPGSKFFVARLDEGGRDKENTKAYRIALNAYTDPVEHHLPQVAIDLRERFRSGIHTNRRDSFQHLSKN